MALAESDVTLALYVGESFAEVHLRDQNKTHSFHRWYLGKEGLRAGLTKILKDSGFQKLTKAIVASRFPEKILSYRLGGSVAVLTTEGFESWPRSRQPFALKLAPLSSLDLHFSVSERISSNGDIEKEPSEFEIADIIEKLKLKQAKRVCIHFLNANKNSSNQEKVKAALLHENFEVFTPDGAPPEMDEAALWRRNILNASLCSTFSEVQEEINLALQPYLSEGERAIFLSGDGHRFDKECRYHLNSLWGASYAWAQNLKRSESFDIVYFGLEQFCLLSPQNKTSYWQSPWGKVSNNRIQNHLLCLQPTTAIELSMWNELGFSKNHLGYEPGPMFLGRGQLPTLLDLWATEASDIKGLEERVSLQGIQKFKNQMWALNKSALTPLDSDEKVLRTLRQNAIRTLCADIVINAEQKSLYCLGALAPIFGAELKTSLSEFNIKILPDDTTSSLIGQEK